MTPASKTHDNEPFFLIKEDNQEKQLNDLKNHLMEAYDLENVDL
jgi:hypothetical protein